MLRTSHRTGPNQSLKGEKCEPGNVLFGSLADIQRVEIEILPKDEALERLAASHNVAQFVSFGPGETPTLRHCQIMGVPTNHRFANLEEAIAELLDNSSDRTVKDSRHRD